MARTLSQNHAVPGSIRRRLALAKTARAVALALDDAGSSLSDPTLGYWAMQMADRIAKQSGTTVADMLCK